MNDNTKAAPQGVACNHPPMGYRCTRAKGHDGPCACIRIGSEADALQAQYDEGYQAGFNAALAQTEQAAPQDVASEDKNYPFYELRYIMRVLSHQGGAPEQDWQTAYGMAKAIFARWHKDQIAPAQTEQAAPRMGAAPGEKECRHCGWMCYPKPEGDARGWHPLEQTTERMGAAVTGAGSEREEGEVELTLPQRIDEIANLFGSLREAASVLGIDTSYMSRLRSGEKTEPSDDILKKLGLKRRVVYLHTRRQYVASPLIPRTRSA